MRKKCLFITIFLILVLLINVSAINAATWGVSEGKTYKYEVKTYTDCDGNAIEGEGYYTHNEEDGGLAPLAQGMFWMWSVEFITASSIQGTFSTSSGFTDNFISYYWISNLWPDSVPATPFIDLDVYGYDNWDDMTADWDDGNDNIPGNEDDRYSELTATTLYLTSSEGYVEVDLVLGLITEFYWNSCWGDGAGLGASVQVEGSIFWMLLIDISDTPDDGADDGDDTPDDGTDDGDGDDGSENGDGGFGGLSDLFSALNVALNDTSFIPGIPWWIIIALLLLLLILFYIYANEQKKKKRGSRKRTK